jgi:hypothetical protein
MPSIPELQRIAVEFARQGDFGPQALATNLELSKAAPTNEGALTRLSRCYLEGGQLDEATATLDAALQLNPQNTIARSLQLEVTRRRVASTPVIKPARARASRDGGAKAGAVRQSKSRGPVPGLGRAEFAALGQLAPEAAVESLGARFEPLLMAINDRPSAGKAVDTRNRAGYSGARLFRRHTIRSAGEGRLLAFHQGNSWEPLLTVGLHSASAWGRDGLSAGIGFRLAADGSDTDRERALATFAKFQQLIAGQWRGFLRQWMSTSAGFVQIGETPPATDLLPDAALTRLIALEQGDLAWVFFGRWLFIDRAADAEVLADGRRLTSWIDGTFNDLLPVWTSLYRA